RARDGLLDALVERRLEERELLVAADARRALAEDRALGGEVVAAYGTDEKGAVGEIEVALEEARGHLVDADVPRTRDAQQRHGRVDRGPDGCLPGVRRGAGGERDA